MSLDTFIGQNLAVKRLRHIARKTQPSDRMISLMLSAAPGMGKGRLSREFAKDAGAKYFHVNGSALEDSKSINDLLKGPVQHQGRSIICIDECHQINRKTQTCLLTALEEPFVLETVIKQGGTILTYRFQIPTKISWIFLTDRMGELPKAISSRLEVVQFEDYTQKEKELILDQYLTKKNLSADSKFRSGIARVSRSIRQLIRHIDLSIMYGSGILDQNIFEQLMNQLELTHDGLTKLDLRVLNCIADSDTKKLSLRDIVNKIETETKEYVCSIEPFLSKNGFIEVTQKGRQVTAKGYEAIGRKKHQIDGVLGELINVE